MDPQAFDIGAIFCGKLIQFLVCSVLTIWYGPRLLHSLRHVIHDHASLAIGTGLLAVLLLLLFVIRRVFDKRRGLPLPVEEGGL